MVRGCLLDHELRVIGFVEGNGLAGAPSCRLARSRLQDSPHAACARMGERTRDGPGDACAVFGARMVGPDALRSVQSRSIRTSDLSRSRARSRPSARPFRQASGKFDD